jgi:hypothetical protein
VLVGLACGAGTWLLATAFEAGPATSGALALAGVLLVAGVLVAAWRAQPLASLGFLAAGVLLVTLLWFALVNPAHERMSAGTADAAEVAHWKAVAERHPLTGRIFQVEPSDEGAPQGGG